MKTSEQTARDFYQSGKFHSPIICDGDLLRDVMRQAIDHDRTQREAELRYLVIASQGRRYPESIVGRYAAEFDANAVAKEWNRINNRNGITYRVEDDA